MTHFFETLPSTNDYLKKLGEDGVRDWTTVIADTQTAGRGRRTKSFFSPSKSGLYMSFIFHPETDKTSLITPICALSVCNALKELFNADTEIKWVNDVYFKGKKLCGILCESSFDKTSTPYCVVGVGLNLSVPEGGFPPMENNTPTALFDRCENFSAVRNDLAQKIVHCFRELYFSEDIKSIHSSYKEKCFVLGKEVKVTRGNQQFPARVIDLNPDFSLKLEAEGEILNLNSGEISLKLK